MSLMPLLPPELERDIFELAARTHRGTAVNLTLVARRVQIWIERVIYEVVSLSDRNKCSSFLRTLNTRSVQFFDEHVKALCLPYYLDMDQASRILSVCRHVNNLECWAQRGSSPFSLCSAPQLDPLSSSSPSSTPPQTVPAPLLPCPSRLSVNMRDLFHSSPPDFSLQLFANITHLRVADSWLFWSTWPSFAPIPILTHLALDFSGAGPAHIPRLAPVLVRILRIRLRPCARAGSRIRGSHC
ncbi:hypothetical protein BD779DRAFT_1591568 [Infundibulicybe gibba]|nr:hypothetical protein BD779DRAFT_1591568 [Infundibulicybe gibba]